MIHLDTNTVVAYLRGDTRVAVRLSAALPDVGISAVVLMELLFGARISARSRKNLEKIAQLVGLAPPVTFDETCAATGAEVKTHLRSIGKPTGENDILIAATALAHNATLVTHNTRHYENIPYLRLDEWLA